MPKEALTQPFEKTVATRLQRDPAFMRAFLEDLAGEFPKVKMISATGFKPCRVCVDDDGNFNQHGLCAGCYQNMTVINEMYAKLDRLAVSINRIAQSLPEEPS